VGAWPVREETIVDGRGRALQEHPAVGAWQRVVPRAGVPTSIAILQEKEKSAVYRLGGMDCGGVSLIAKRCRADTAVIERVIYEEVLPHLPVARLRYYGCVEDGQSSWLFLEDAGGVPFSIGLAEHRVMASRWLALMHTSAMRAAADRLPDRGAAYYLVQLRSARETIQRGFHNPKLDSGDRKVLDAVVIQCDILESRWHRLEESSAEVPRTLVHGDFRPKNVRIRTGNEGTDLVALDWETAGWGTPAVDLASARARPINLIDIATYYSIARESWPTLDVRSILRLISVGWIFRRLAAISWDCLNLTSPWPQKAVASMRVYQAELAHAMRAAKWNL
jgi:hypothetical protein